MNRNIGYLSRTTYIILFSSICLLIIFSMIIKNEKYLQISSYRNNLFQWKSNKIVLFFNHSEDEQTSIDEYSLWCLNMGQQLENEFYLPQSPIIKSPILNSSKLHRFPYRYSLWKSSTRLSRGFNQCEHHLAMHLLMIIERICRKYHIEFMLFYGSLLGSWRHHDIIPWDDDLDIIIDDKQRNSFINLMKQLNNTIIKYDTFSWGGKTKEYYKISLKNTHSAGSYQWNFPFVDVFVYQKNQTHFWSMVEPNEIINIENIFPLIKRPFGELWLPSPRFPQKLFSFNPYDLCQGKSYNHKKETTAQQISVQCKDLFDVYPFVQRNNYSNSTEILKLNHQIVHTVIFS